MSRRSIIKKNYIEPDSLYNSYLVSLLIVRVLKQGKKRLASSIIYEAFELIKQKTGNSPMPIFETAIKKTTPKIAIKAKRIGGSNYQVPLDVSRYRGTTLALRWLIKSAKERSGKSISFKLANEIIDASKGIGNTIRKREETHKMAEANKAFAHFRY